MAKRRDINREKLKPVVVKSVQDIRKAIAPFVKEAVNGKVDINGDVKWVDEDGNKHVTNVESHSSDPSMRQGLIDGFEHVKQYSQMWNRIHNVLDDDEYGASLPYADIDKMYLPVDKLIRYRLGGRREGLTVVWDLPDKKVVFDPYSKKLEESV